MRTSSSGASASAQSVAGSRSRVVDVEVGEAVLAGGAARCPPPPWPASGRDTAPRGSRRRARCASLPARTSGRRSFSGESNPHQETTIVPTPVPRSRASGADDDLGVRRRVEPPAREVRRREDGRAVCSTYQCAQRPSFVGCRVPRVVEDGDALGAFSLRAPPAAGSATQAAATAAATNAGIRSAGQAPRGSLQRAPDRRRLRSEPNGGISLPDRRRRHDRRRRVPRDPRARRGRHDRRSSARSRTRRTSGRRSRRGCGRASDEELDLARHAPSSASSSTLGRRDRRRSTSTRARATDDTGEAHALRAAAARDRRHAATAARAATTTSSTSARSTTTARLRGARRRGRALRRDRRRVHRLGDRRRARDERLRR